MENLWGFSVIDVPVINTPKGIITEQSILIGKISNNNIIGEVRLCTSEQDFGFVFNIIAPRLNSYTKQLFSIEHNVDMYPVTVRTTLCEFLKINGDGITSDGCSCICDDERAFTRAIRYILTSIQVKNIISSIINQSREY